MIKPEDYDADAPAGATGAGPQYAPSSAAPPPFVKTPQRASTSPGISTPNLGAGIVVVLAVVLGLLLLVVVPARNKAAADQAAQAAADASSQAQRAEEIRIADRVRVERGIEGVWSNGSSRLTIQRAGSALTAIYVPASGNSYHLGAELLPSNQVKLRSNQVGKIVNPFRYWQGDFSQESWLELGADGNSLSARFSEAPNGPIVMMTRITDNSVAAQPQQDPVIGQEGTVAANESADISDKARGDERERQLAAEEEARSAEAARRAAAQAAQLELEQRAAVQAEANGERAPQLPLRPETVGADPAVVRTAAAERLTADTRTRWSATDTVIESGSATAYLLAADHLRAALATIAAFERANGATSVTRGLWERTVQKLNDEVIGACDSENVVKRARGLRQVPCPSQN